MMNYVGSISILDRGDAPAQAVIDRNARSLAQRIADETKDELDKVMTRVETIYSSFEMTDHLYSGSNLEYLQDIGELEEIMKDQVKKKKYQQQVTIFVVGFSEVSSQKLRLMQQVNEFFMENSKKVDEEDWFPTTPDMDLDEVGEKIEDSLQVAHNLSKRLGELNKEMVDFMANYAEKKASNKGKKKMEKALLQAKVEVQNLAEKLQSVRSELEEKDEKLQATFKQLEVKNLEVQKFRTAAELAKQKIILLQKELDEQKRTAEDAKRDLAKLHDEQLVALREVHQQDMDEMKQQHDSQIMSLSGITSDSQSDVPRQFDLDSEATPDGISRQSSKQESRPSTQKSGKTGAKKPGAKSPTRGKDGKTGSRASTGTKSDKEYAEVGIQDEGGDHASATVEEGGKAKTPGTRHSRRSKSTLEPVQEFEDFEDAYDLNDEQSWAEVPKDQLQGRFAQYRRLCHHRLREAEEQRQLTVAKTQRKVQLLKAQFVEHKNKWEAERKILIEQLEQAQKLQTDAEKEADAAMTQLEDFITEQEQLEEQEEVRRSAILRTASGSSLSPGTQTPAPKTPQTPQPPATPAATANLSTPPESQATNTSDELHSLLQQTDDAKVEEMNTRGRVTGTKSAPPMVDMTTMAKEDVAKDQAAAPEDSADGAKKQATDLETVDGEGEEAGKAVPDLSNLQDLPAIEGSEGRDSSAASVQPPPTAATIGSLPSHGQLETPLAEIADMNASAYAEGDKQDGETTGEPREDTSNLEKSRTDITEDRQGTEISEQMMGKETSRGLDGKSDTTADSTAASKEAQPPSKTPDTIIRIDELEASHTEEELRAASARSRASLRYAYKSRLGESRMAAEDRRSKSPVISVPTKLSVDDELTLDEDEDDDDIALPDDMKEELEEERRKDFSMYEIGTSPPPGPGKDPSSHSVRFLSRKSTSLVDHPLLKEYLKTYKGVTGFKDILSKMFLDKDMMSASQILSDLETIVFDREKQVMPQVEEISVNVLFILEEISGLINNAVMVDREPVVSSLLPFSREEVRSRLPLTREASEDASYTAYTHPKMVTPNSGPVSDQVYVSGFPDDGFAGVGRGGVAPTAGGVETAGEGSLGGGSRAGSQVGSQAGSRKSSMSGSTKQHLSELQGQCMTLQHQLEDKSKKHEEQLRHNTVVMMEMQDTINELQRELSALGKASKKPRSAASSIRDATAKTPSPDTSLMFTRLDLERNAKIMKKAVMDERLDAEKYKDAVSTMDEYVSLPAQRLAHLVKKYVHHTRMKEIEENVKNSESLDEKVFDALDKMEALQNQRARQWAETMDSMGLERLRLAAMLMDSLDSIEQESGLFLIKPMYSYRGRELKAPPTHKLARPRRTQPVQRHQSESRASFVPAPTPASNMRRPDRHTPVHQVPVEYVSMPPPPPSRPEDGVVGSGAIRNIITPQAPQLIQSHQTWNIGASQTRSPKDMAPHLLNTPRMLELDINRMLIGQNNISSVLPHPLTDDRLVNASNNSLRTYITVHRPTAALAGDRPGSANGAPPSSPSPRPPVAVSPTDRGVPTTMTSPPPLPPIGDLHASPTMSVKSDPGDADIAEPPRSPPGSSMYQSTNRDAEDANLMKQATRASSGLSNTSSFSDYGDD